MNTDEQLMLAFQTGSRESFAELFERYREPVYRFFRRRIDHAARAEELAQECFLAVLRNSARYEPRSTFRSYLYGVAMHMVYAERRKAGREVSENEKLDQRVDGRRRSGRNGRRNLGARSAGTTGGAMSARF